MHIVPGLVGRGGGVLLEFAVILRPHRLLKQVDGLGIVQVLLGSGTAPELMSTDAGQIHVNIQAQRVEGLPVPILQILLDIVHGNAAHPAGGVGEILVNDAFADAHSLENLAALVGLDGGNAHFRGDLHNARQHRLVVVADGGVVILFQHTALNQTSDALLSKVGIDGAGTVAQQGGKVVNQPGLAAFQNQSHGRALAGAHQIFGHRTHCQQTGNGHMVFVDFPVGQNQNVGSVPVGSVNIHKEPLDGLFQRGVLIVADGNRLHLESGHIHGLDAKKVRFREDGVVDFQHLAVVRLLFQQVTLGTGVDRGGSDDLLPEGVNGRVRHLGEHLLEVVKERRMGVAERRQGGVAAHGSGRLAAVFRHLQQDVVHILIAVAEGLLQPHQLLVAGGCHLLIGHLQVGQIHQVPIQPFAVGLTTGVVRLQLLVVHQPSPDGVHQQHFARTEPVFPEDGFLGNVQHAHLAGENQPSVICDVIPAGSQAVPVENRAHHVAVAEQDRGRAVPRLQHGGIVLVEVPLLGIHAPVVAPRLRDGHHDGQRQLHAVHEQKFQGVVQHGRVRAPLVDDGQDLRHIVLQVLTADGLLPSQHGIDVSSDGVDFAVVKNVAVGVSPVPAGGGVGGEPAVHHADGGLVVLVLQVRVKQPQLLHQEHALVDDSSAGQAAHIGTLAGLLEDPAHHIQPPVKVDALVHPGRLAHEGLPDAGHTASGLVTQHLRAHGHLPPAQEGQSFLLADDFE